MKICLRNIGFFCLTVLYLHAWLQTDIYNQQCYRAQFSEMPVVSVIKRKTFVTSLQIHRQEHLQAPKKVKSFEKEEGPGEEVGGQGRKWGGELKL